MRLSTALRRLLYPLVITLLAGMIVPCSALAAGYIPAEGCYLGAYIRLDQVSGGDIDLFEETVGVQHASYFRYVGYGSPFPFRWVREMHSRGMLPHIAWEPNDGLDPVRDDDYLRGWMEAAARTEGPIFLRYASEMNGTWQNYSGYPEEYIKKWKLVTRVARQLAPNVIMVWCPFATPQATIEDFYPGDAWVDWVGVNIYSVHHYDGHIRKPADDDPRELLRYVYDLYADRKPIAICEYAATHYCAACDQDVTEFGLEQLTRLYESLPDQFPRVKMINWFCVDAMGTGLASNNYSLTSSEPFMERYRELVATGHFLGRLPDVSKMVASLPPTSPEPASGLPDVSTDYGPLEVPPEEEPEPQPEPDPAPPPASDTPPEATEHPLALAAVGPVRSDELAVTVLGAPPTAATGTVDVLARPGEDLEVSVVAFYVDGDWRAITNARPYRYEWQTSYEEPGVHEIRVEAMNSASVTIMEKTVSVIVAPQE